MRTLCAVFAHPDDESFSSGGTLSRYAAEGVEITLVTATSGEAGMITGEKLEIADLRSWRERELRKAAGILGVKHVRLLGLPDGKLAESSQALTQSIRGILFEIRPQVVLTEDVQGITGHPDHVAVTHAVVRAVEDLGESGPLKIYEHVLPLSKAPEGIQGTPEDYITTRIDVESWREQLLSALAAHRSQVPHETIHMFRGFPAPWIDHFVCVRTTVPILIPEDDLFAGIDR